MDESRSPKNSENASQDLAEMVSIPIDSGELVRGVFVACLTAEIVLLTLDALISFAGLVDLKPIRRLVDITLEANIPTWFASTQALVAAAILWLICLKARMTSEPRGRVLGWALLASLFTFIALDDATQLHEDIGNCVKILRDRGTTHSFLAYLQRYPSYYWHVTLGPLFGAMGLFMAVFLWRHVQPQASRSKIVFAFVLYAVALGLDFIDSDSKNYDIIRLSLSTNFRTAQHLCRAIEEFLEMLATTIFLVVFLEHLCRVSSIIQVRFEKNA